MTEAQRRAILADIIDPIWGSAPDHEIADAHGVAPRAVRELRAGARRDLGIAALAPRLEELGDLIAWPGSPGELLAACVDAALMRAQARERREGHGSPMARHRAVQEAQRGAAMETATLDPERPAAPPVEPNVLDCGRSADRVVSRSQARAEASEGASGDRDPRLPASRGVGWGRGRVGHGPAAAAEQRDG